MVKFNVFVNRMKMELEGKNAWLISRRDDGLLMKVMFLGKLKAIDIINDGVDDGIVILSNFNRYYRNEFSRMGQGHYKFDTDNGTDEIIDDQRTPIEFKIKCVWTREQ